MNDFDTSKYKGLKRKLAITLDGYHCIVNESAGETRGILIDQFDAVIEEIVLDFKDSIEISRDINKLL